eukprot:g30397.t1
MFVITKRFGQAVTLINQTDEKKLPLLVSRVLQEMTVNPEAEKLFTDEVEQSLQNAFAFSHEQLDTLVSASVYIFEQAAYKTVSASKLKAGLETAGMKASAAMAFAQIWNEKKAAYVATLKSKSFGAPQKLDSVKWSLQLALGDSAITKTKHLKGVLQLGLKNEQEGSEENVILEFSQSQLEDLYENLELIQKQLDTLSENLCMFILDRAQKNGVAGCNLLQHIYVWSSNMVTLSYTVFQVLGFSTVGLRHVFQA